MRRPRPHVGTRVSAPVLALVLAAPPATATDVEPRLYSNVPVGVNFLTLSYANSQGDVAFDSSVPVQDVDGRINQAVLSYARGLDILGKSGLLTVAVPFAEARLNGLYLGQPASGERRGVGDPRIRLAVNLAGAPALRRQAFAAYRQKTIVGLNLTVTPPLGRYQPDRVINIGTNRWNLLGQLGLSHKRGPWTLESALGASWSSDNQELRGDNLLEQDPFLIYRGTLLYDLTPSAWLGLGVSYVYGGETSLNGVERDDRMSNWRAGVAVSFAVAPGQRVQLRATEGVIARIGQDFHTYGVSYTLTF